MKTTQPKPSKELPMSAKAFDKIMSKALQVKPEEVAPKKPTKTKAKKKRASK